MPLPVPGLAAPVDTGAVIAHRALTPMDGGTMTMRAPVLVSLKTAHLPPFNSELRSPEPETDYRMKSTVPALRSTFAVRLSAPIHADACTWLPDRSLAHQGR
jgi:hypothetical protein